MLPGMTSWSTSNDSIWEHRLLSLVWLHTVVRPVSTKVNSIERFDTWQWWPVLYIIYHISYFAYLSFYHINAWRRPDKAHFEAAGVGRVWGIERDDANNLPVRCISAGWKQRCTEVQTTYSRVLLFAWLQHHILQESCGRTGPKGCRKWYKFQRFSCSRWHGLFDAR